MAKGKSVEGQSAERLLSELERDGVKAVHLGLFDLDCVLRERRFRLEQLGRYLRNDPTFVNVLHKWDVSDSVTGAGPFVGEPIAADPDSRRPYPFEDNVALVLADYTGPSRDVSAREILRAQVDRAQAKGLRRQGGVRVRVHPSGRNAGNAQGQEL